MTPSPLAAQSDQRGRAAIVAMGVRGRPIVQLGDVKGGCSAIKRRAGGTLCKGQPSKHSPYLAGRNDLIQLTLALAGVDYVAIPGPAPPAGGGGPPSPSSSGADSGRSTPSCAAGSSTASTSTSADGQSAPQPAQPQTSYVQRYVDEDVELGCQGSATMRHLGRKHGLYGGSLQEQVQRGGGGEGWGGGARAFCASLPALPALPDQLASATSKHSSYNLHAAGPHRPAAGLRGGHPPQVHGAGLRPAAGECGAGW